MTRVCLFDSWNRATEQGRLQIFVHVWLRSRCSFLATPACGALCLRHRIASLLSHERGGLRTRVDAGNLQYSPCTPCVVFSSNLTGRPPKGGSGWLEWAPPDSSSSVHCPGIQARCGCPPRQGTRAKTLADTLTGAPTNPRSPARAARVHKTSRRQSLLHNTTFTRNIHTFSSRTPGAIDVLARTRQSGQWACRCPHRLISPTRHACRTFIAVIRAIGLRAAPMRRADWCLDP